MLLRFRRHVRGNVVAYIALFFSLGGTAMAAVVVSSNAQIGPNTIYGTNAPTGANRNVIADSITGADVRESLLGRVPSATTALNGARRIDFDAVATASESYKTVLKLNEMTLEAACIRIANGGPVAAYLRLRSTIAGDVNWVFSDNANVNEEDTRPNAGGRSFAANEDAVIHGVASPFTDGFTRSEGQFVYHNAKRVIAVTLHLVANGSTSRCQATGVAVPAPG